MRGDETPKPPAEAPSQEGRERSRLRRLVRRLSLALLAVVGLVLVLAIGAVFSLRFGAVRRAILRQVEARTEAALGGVLLARDFAVDLRAGTLRIENLAYGVRGAQPVLTAERLLASIDPRALTRGRVLIRSLVLDRPHIDLSAPLPGMKRDPAIPGKIGVAPAVEILSAEIRDGAITSIASDDPLNLRANGIHAKVNDPLGDAFVRLTVESLEFTPGARLAAKMPAFTKERLALRIETEVGWKGAGGMLGRVDVESLRVTGSGIALRAGGSGERGRPETWKANIDVEVDPSKLAILRRAVSPDEPARIHLVTSLDGAVNRAEATLDAGSLALDVVRDLAPFAALDRLRVSGTVLDARAVLACKPSEIAPARLVESLTASLFGRLDATWRRAKQPLVVARLERRESPMEKAPNTGEPSAGVSLFLSAELLPELVGTRRLTATVRAADWLSIPAGRLTDGLIELDAPSVREALLELHEAWPDLVPAAAGGVEIPELASVRATAEMKGPLSAPFLTVHGEARPLGASSPARVALSGRGEPLARRGEGSLTVDALPLVLGDPSWQGEASGQGSFSYRAGNLTGEIRLAGHEISFGPETPRLDRIHVEVLAEGREVRVPRAEVAIGKALVSASGHANIEAPWRDSSLRLVARDPVRGVDSIEALATARNGTLFVDIPMARTAGGDMAASAAAPLGALRRLLEPRHTALLPEGLPTGPVFVSLDAPGVSSCRLLDGLRETERRELVSIAESLAARLPREARGGLVAALSIDPEDPSATSVDVALADLAVETGLGTVRAIERVAMRLRDGEVALAPVELVGPSTRLELLAGATLSRASFAALVARLLEREPAAVEAGPARSAQTGVLEDLVESLSLSAKGDVESVLLQPFLAGGLAAGPLSLDLKLAGRPSAFSGRARIDGSRSSVLWPAPYVTRLEAPRLDVTFDGTATALIEGKAVLNGGGLELAGRGTTESLDLTARFSEVRYRLAYGLGARFDGRLSLLVPKEGRSRLTGALTLDRGLLDRDIDLDQEILTRLFSPPESEGTEASVLDALDLDITLGTTTGVRIRNNLADLRAVWSSLAIVGTARTPVPRGRIEIEKGGLVFAYNQVVRIEKGSLTYTGDPTLDPKIDVVTSIESQAGSRSGSGLEGFGSTRAVAGSKAGGDVADGSSERPSELALAEGVAGYYGERLASKLNEAIGFVRVSLRPLLVFGETDPGTRLTLARDVSRNVVFALSLDLKNAERQTYLVDVHDVPGLPALTGQVFTNEGGAYGGTLQQRLEFGGSGREPTSALRLSRVVFDSPPPVSERKLRQAIRLAKGDPLPDGAAFDVEIEAAAYLRDRGFPDARVKATVLPSKKPGRAELRLAIEPGPRVEVAFTGDAPPAPSRRAIAALYRGGSLEESALDEMRRRTVRVLRSLGHLDPRVGIAIRSPKPGEVVVDVHVEAGPRRMLGTAVFRGLGERETRILARRFSGTLERVELASFAPSAEKRILDTLASLGYPAARIASREVVEEDGVTRPVVAIEPGTPSLLDSVRVEGLEEISGLEGVSAVEERDIRDREGSARPLVDVARNDVAAQDRIVGVGLRIEDALRRRGHSQALVRIVLGPVSPEIVPRLSLVYRVEPGPAYRLGDVRFEGRRFGSPSFLRRVARLTPGSIFQASEVDEARARLFGVGLYSSVRAEALPRPAGPVLGPATDVVFTLESRPRFALAYGFRWENGAGFSGVVDLLDRNLLGRAISLGLRGLYSPTTRAVRLFLGAEDLLGSRFSFEGFAETRRTIRENASRGTEDIEDSKELTLQLSRPLTRALTGRVYFRYKDTLLFESPPDPFLPFEVSIKLPYVGTQFLYDTREDPLLGKSGVFASLDLQASGAFLSSDFNFVRAFGQVNVYRPIPILGLQLSWAQSVRLGVAKAFDQELGRDVRFFAGGEYSVRGFSTDSLGPRDFLDGSPTGGSTLFIVNEELRFPLFSRLSGLVFVDIGGIWESARDFGQDVAKAAGLGLRANTPFGVLRVDAARPFTRREGDAAYKVYFGFGNVF